MNAMLAAFVALVIVTVGAYYGLNMIEPPFRDERVGEAVRLD